MAPWTVPLHTVVASNASSVCDANITANSTLPASHPSYNPAALERTAYQAAVVFLFCCAIHLFARHWPNLYASVFTPRAARGVAGARAYPGLLGAFREAAATCRTVLNLEAGLESAMLQRYILLNIRLIGCALLLACALLPLYASDSTAAIALNSTDEDAVGMLEALTLSQLPAGDNRLCIAGIAGLLYAIVYVDAVGREYREYRALKLQWLASENGVEHCTLLLTVDAEHAVGSDEVSAALNDMTASLFAQQGQVVRVAPLMRLRDAAAERSRLRNAGGRSPMLAPAIAPTAATPPAPPGPLLLGSAVSGLGGSGRLADAAVTLLASPHCRC